MGLIKKYYNKELDVIIPDCYWKIASNNGIIGGKDKIRVLLYVYRNKQIADMGGNEIGGYSFEFKPDLDSDLNIIKQAYIYAKTLPDFTEAIIPLFDAIFQ